jgi:hypothetical protein
MAFSEFGMLVFEFLGFGVLVASSPEGHFGVVPLLGRSNFGSAVASLLTSWRSDIMSERVFHCPEGQIWFQLRKLDPY